ncbi:MAG: diaminopimelate epimerase [Armatimonadetes bacterium]|nr:diaminopimelate epimerase [Armatimonadota bacterium]
MPFVKMQGIGNDFVVIDGTDMPEMDWPEIAVRTADRHFGIGSDGLLVILPSVAADFRMRMFNPDGTEDFCGNGLRCMGKYVYDCGLTRQTSLKIETSQGLKDLLLLTDGPQAQAVRVNLGPPRLHPGDIPMKVNAERVIDYPLEVDGEILKITALSAGTAHAVVFVPEGEGRGYLDRYGSRVERHPLFPERTSVLFCEVRSRREMALTIWERAVGETLACGTGACAAAVAARLHGLTDPEVDVTSAGGTLHIAWEEGSDILMTGPAAFVFEGVWLEEGE